MSNWRRVNQRNKCVICGRADWCGIASDGSAAICMRVESDKQAGNGGFVHKLSDDIKPAPVVAEKPAPVVASIERRHAVYSLLLENLFLSKHHKNNLLSRGLNESAINRNHYRSVPYETWAKKLAASLSGQIDLTHVPGFYKTDAGAWQLQTYGASGFFVPIVDECGRINALQIRRDDAREPKYLLVSSAGKPGGASSGAPLHFASIPFGVHQTELIITEGALKAEVIAHFTRQAVAGLVGVGCFDNSLPARLKKTMPALSRVYIAFDMDYQTNQAVNRQKERLTCLLGNARLKVSSLEWDSQFKGYDDFLSSNLQRIAA